MTTRLVDAPFLPWGIASGRKFKCRACAQLVQAFAAVVLEHKGAEISASYDELAQVGQVAKSTVRRALAELVDGGWLERRQDYEHGPVRYVAGFTLRALVRDYERWLREGGPESMLEGA